MAEPDTLLEAPVHQVHLFEDRATIIRRVQLDTPGRHRVAIEGLSPLIQERTVACTGPGIRVEDIRVHRSRMTREEADDPRTAALVEALQAASDRLDQVRAETARASDALDRAERQKSTAHELFARALLGPDAPEDWLAALRTLHDGVTHAAVRRTTLMAELDTLEAEVTSLRRRIDAARTGSRVHTARLALQVLVETPGALEIRYTLPCALWRPVHRASLHDQTLSWETGALAWNATGESWEGVQIVCSTARPGDQATPPLLTDDLVTLAPRGKAVRVEAREEQITEARVGAPVPRGDVGVADGGETRTFTAAAPVDLPSDGRPVHLALERWEDSAQATWMGHPERASEVVLRSTQRNRGTAPLLAGPVTLIRDGIAVGRGEISLILPGEAFHLGWGSHDGLRVVRRRDHETERSRISGRQLHRFRVELKVTHTGDRPVRFQLTERIPVSEVKEVSVGNPTAEPPLSAGPDGDGFCTWQLSMSPGEIRVFSLSFTVEAGSQVELAL